MPPAAQDGAVAKALCLVMGSRTYCALRLAAREELAVRTEH